MSEAIVVVNAGSTSLKFGAYAVDDAAGSLPLLCRGRIDSMQGDPHFVVQNAAGKPLDTHEWGEGHAIDHSAALRFVITWLEANLGDRKVIAAGHRIVLGGARFEAPVRIEGDVLDYLESLAVMEPSHQIFNVRAPGRLPRPSQVCPRWLVSIARFIEQCRKWRKITHCPSTCAILGCAIGATTAFPMTT